MQESGIRLQRYLSERGIASRRKAADVIAAGRIAVNGEVVREPGWRVHPDRDRVRIDGVAIEKRIPRARTILLNKPRGYVCSRRGQGARTVCTLLGGIKESLLPVGRLDKDSEGLLLMSNDGELIHRLSHPRFEKEKTYRVTVRGRVGSRELAILRAAQEVDGHLTRPARVRLLGAAEQAGSVQLVFILHEGRKRQIRVICGKAGLKVLRLVRTDFGELSLGGLGPGEWRDLTTNELSCL